MSTHVFLFKPRFAPLVEAGTKRTTIRPPRTRPVRLYDLMDLRTWTGRPYKDPQRKLCMGRCVEHQTCVIIPPFGRGITGTPGKVLLGLREPLIGAEADAFARNDGFADYAEMIAWFQKEHGKLPFLGTWYRWEPIAS